MERLQEIMSALLGRRLHESLDHVHRALVRWKAGELGVFEAHAALLEHAARSERLAERMARLGTDRAGSLLRDAFEAELLTRSEFVRYAGKEPEEVSPSGAADDERPDLPPKRELVEELLGAGPVLIHIDARKPSARVPASFKDDPKLVLRVGYGLRPAIIDLSVDDEALSGTLTFGGVPHRCTLPWDAVYAAVSEIDHKGMVWPDDVPESVAASLLAIEGESERNRQTDERPVIAPARGRKTGGHLKLVD